MPFENMACGRRSSMTCANGSGIPHSRKQIQDLRLMIVQSDPGIFALSITVEEGTPHANYTHHRLFVRLRTRDGAPFSGERLAGCRDDADAPRGPAAGVGAATSAAIGCDPRGQYPGGVGDGRAD